MLTIHASCVAIAGHAVLLRGPSNSGKSDLALRLIDSGARLIADDRTRLQRQGAALIASAPESIEGLIELRGLGPVELPVAPPMPVRLILDLVPRDAVPRLPEPRYETILEIALPCLAFDAFAASAAIKAKLALERAVAGCLFEPAEARSPVALPQARRA